MTVKQLTANLKGKPPQRPVARVLTTPASTGMKVPLQFKIPEEERRKFKAEAATRGLDNSVLFLEMWEHYKKQNNL